MAWMIVTTPLHAYSKLRRTRLWFHSLLGTRLPNGLRMAAWPLLDRRKLVDDFKRRPERLVAIPAFQYLHRMNRYSRLCARTELSVWPLWDEER